MRRAAIIALAVACVGLGACARNLDTVDPQPDAGPPTPEATTLSLQLQNGGAVAAYVYQGCLIDYKVTSLADPSMTINRVEGCLCSCGQNACPVCGACYAGAREVAAGTQITESWLTATVTTESGGPFGSCQRLHALPAGSYRIELPVYASEADAAAKVSPRVVTQVVTLPAPDDTIVIPVGISR
jgi:hypothetical protein